MRFEATAAEKREILQIINVHALFHCATSTEIEIEYYFMYINLVKAVFLANRTDIALLSTFSASFRVTGTFNVSQTLSFAAVQH